MRCRVGGLGPRVGCAAAHACINRCGIDTRLTSAGARGGCTRSRAENPALPDALARASRPIVFVGPPSRPMRALGDKIGSTIIAQSAGAPAGRVCDGFRVHVHVCRRICVSLCVCVRL